MELETFLSKHLNALEADQTRHNLLLGILNHAKKNSSAVRLWSLGDGAACAIQTPPNYLVLGDLNQSQCDELAKATLTLDFRGCNGSNDTAEMLVKSFARLGIAHELGMPQRIYVLEQSPKYPSCDGNGRQARPDDLKLFCDWFSRFCHEAVPHEPPPAEARMAETFADRPTFFWEVNGKPVSMAARSRETKNGSNISLVFTPSELRGKGFAGSITSFACEDAFKEGKTVCFLYTDLRNPISNKVYQKIGFRGWCDSKTYTRLPADNRR